MNPSSRPERAGVYIHVPWCRRRCPYCDFYFEVGKAQLQHQPDFASAIEFELRARAHELPSNVTSLYLGGGTPSMLPAGQFLALKKCVEKTLRLSPTMEFSVELNPEDVTEALASELSAAGVTRVSLGVQSFDDAVLRGLGRAHSGAEAEKSISLLRDASLSSISVDLIIGCAQSRTEEEKRLAADIDVLQKWSIEHVSAYALTVEERTPLHKLIQLKKRLAPDEDVQVDALLYVQEHLPRLGLEQYEISSFARVGFESQHNRVYWSQGSYLGLGPGAHSMRLEPSGDVVRTHTIAKLSEWERDPAAAAQEHERLPKESALLEAVAFGLRDLKGGISLPALEARHHTPIPQWLHERLQAAVARAHLVEHAQGHYGLTSQGALFADALARDVLDVPDTIA